jgi:putative transposase
MQDENSLAHSVWECKYHVVWIPKYRRKKLYGQLRTYLGERLRELAKQKDSTILEGHMCPDHIHMLIQIPPKHSVARVTGCIKGKSAIAIARNYMGKTTATGQSFWARGYYVSTVGRNVEVIRKYIQEQETEDKRVEQLALFKEE